MHETKEASFGLGMGKWVAEQRKQKITSLLKLQVEQNLCVINIAVSHQVLRVIWEFTPGGFQWNISWIGALIRCTSF